jgi:RND family efflux transporter MFP subunit
MKEKLKLWKFTILILVLIVLIVLIVKNTLSGSRKHHHGHNSKASSEQRIYVCPMHPSYTSNKPGECPICGMKLVDKTPKEDHSAHEMSKEGNDSDIKIDVNKQQLIGIATTKVKKQKVSKEIKALGTVTPDERLINHVHTRISGYIEKVYADYEGKFVNYGDPLFTIYSPELVSTQEEYLLALKAEKQLSGTNYDLINQSQRNLKEASLRRLKLWNISEREIKNLEESKAVKKDLTIYSNYSGFITERVAFEGLTVDPMTSLYEITNLSRVWVIAEIYEEDLADLAIGQKVFVRFPYESSNSFEGSLTYIYPKLDSGNRTVKARVEVNNPGFKLKPNMYVDAYISQSLGEQLIVPKSAIIDTGEKKIAFVKTGEGSFLPTEVEIGSELDIKESDLGIERRYQVITSGLTEDDFVVTEGNFLLDSESNLQSTMNQMVGGHKH